MLGGRELVSELISIQIITLINNRKMLLRQASGVGRQTGRREIIPG
jgi:hypothetical protein